MIIIGAGDHGRGTLDIVRASQATTGYVVTGFIDDAAGRQGTFVDGVPVLGDVNWILDHHRSDCCYILGIADCGAKRRVVERLSTRDLEYACAVHPSVSVGSGVVIMRGAIINAGVRIAYDTTIGEHTTLNLNATVGHDCKIGRFATIAPGANIAGRVSIGDGCDIGLNATIGKGLSVEANAVVGPGAVVIKNVAAGHRMFGNPARVVPSPS